MEVSSTPTAGTFAYTPAAGTILNAEVGQVLSETFTPTDTVDYTSVTTTATIDIQKATPTIAAAATAPLVWWMILVMLFCKPLSEWAVERGKQPHGFLPRRRTSIIVRPSSFDASARRLPGVTIRE